MYNVGRGSIMQLTISSKGWVVIPADLRKKYGLKPGDAVNIVDYGGVLALVPAQLVEEHRREVERDEQCLG
jgi:AbrB family looped-hinge helix DNA binding protein